MSTPETSPNSAPPNIRMATAEDQPGVIDVIKTVYEEYSFTWDPDDYHYDLYHLQEVYLDAGLPFWVFETEGLIQGTLALDLYPLISEQPETGLMRVLGTDCSMERLYVHPRARRQRIARKLCLTAVQWAKENGRTAMEIWSDKRFGAAHALYIDLGARIVGDRVCDDPDESPEFGLVLNL